ncbi:MAG TPA: glycosyltransferase [Stellaceae bacterium]|jgi:glycosyltransferase involved in cell wall biosynthesis
MATVLHLITDLDTGGAEQMLTRLVLRLDPGRHRSVVVSMTGGGVLSPALARAGIELFSLDMRRNWPDPRGLVRLVRLLRRVRPGIVQTWLYHADLLGLAARAAAGLSCRLYWNIRCTETLDADMIRRLLVWASRTPDIVVVNSLAGKRFHEAIGYRPRRWVHIPNGCDTAAFRFDAPGRRSVRDEWAISPDMVAIGLPARYHPMKDHNNFLGAAARLAAGHPEAVFILAGPGIDPLNKPLAEAIAARGLGDRVRLLGNRRDMVQVYSALDIATLSSAFGEGCPNVLVEAMSCGVPCVATDCGDAAEVLGPDGVVVPPRDPQALAAGWERLVAIGPAARQSLGAQARDRIMQRYDLGVIAAQYDALYARDLAGDAQVEAAASLRFPPRRPTR